jgi:hypothetical protein
VPEMRADRADRAGIGLAGKQPNGGGPAWSGVPEIPDRGSSPLGTRQGLSVLLGTVLVHSFSPSRPLSFFPVSPSFSSHQKRDGTGRTERTTTRPWRASCRADGTWLAITRDVPYRTTGPIGPVSDTGPPCSRPATHNRLGLDACRLRPAVAPPPATAPAVGQERKDHKG